MSIPTPHISAAYGEIAKTVLMPGDPLRAKFIAETFLTDPVLVNNTRGVQGHTGKWKGVPVTVMASGMGIPSMGIYSWELYNFYGVENIIRVGSAGAISDNLKLMDVIAGMAASTDSNFAHQFGLNGTFAPSADFTLLTEAVAAAGERGVKITVGNILSSDNFYSDGSDNMDSWKKMGILAVEMEAAGLYMNAARAGKRALCICTISDHIYRPEALAAEERQLSFKQMIEIALDTAVRMEKYHYSSLDK
ncbi:MAG TPA: purine-nucleoside phosphorylase [Clostridiales bacterium]|jgi:purine-nucleoside phosphorylase|nr:purine-nucleoside phosphorylase [Clostridiales bacterium]